jgi:DNA-binding transcriptional MerR regulator
MNFEPKKLISSKEIVSKYGIPYSTVTYYTNLGFLMVIKRKGNRRFYDRVEVGRQLKRITELRDTGYPIRLIRKKLAG